MISYLKSLNSDSLERRASCDILHFTTTTTTAPPLEWRAQKPSAFRRFSWYMLERFFDGILLRAFAAVLACGALKLLGVI